MSRIHNYFMTVLAIRSASETVNTVIAIISELFNLNNVVF